MAAAHHPVRVVIAGGSGLLGRHICTALLASGDQPVVLTRDPGRTRASSPAGTRLVHWAPADRSGVWTAELADADAVVNLCGASVGRWPWTRGWKRTLHESRLGATSALVDAVSALPPDRRPTVLVSASGTDRYEGRDAEPATEGTEPVDSFLSRLCEEWELAARRAEQAGMRVVICRFSQVVARDAPTIRRFAFPFRLFLGGPLGSGRQWVSWVDIRDAVGIVTWAVNTPAVIGAINVSAPDPRRQRDFARALGDALHRPAWISTPAWAIRLAMGEQAVLPLGSRRVWPARALAGGYRFEVPRLEDALAAALHAGPVAG
jgi:uncharacterized protein